MNNSKQQHAIHISEMQRLMDSAYQHSQTLNILAWREDGHIVEYRGWKVHHQYWKGGFVRLVNPVSRQIRTVPEIFIFQINGLKVYL